MSSIDKLRQLIREEVALAVRTEMKVMMKELTVLMENNTPKAKLNATSATPAISTNSLKESVKDVFKQQKQVVSTGDPIADLLNETKMGMQSEDYRSIGNFGAQDAPGFAMMSEGLGMRETAVVEDMNTILQASRGAGDVAHVQLPDAVPDFTGLMSSLKAKGAI